MDDREDALHLSVGLGGDVALILRRAELFYLFLRGRLPVRLILDVGQVQDQATGGFVPGGSTSTKPGMAQLHDTEQVDVTVTAVDAKGFEVSDSFTATSADESVATVVAGADGKTFTVVAGVPGSTTLTVGDGNLTATLAVDVVPGDVALIQLSVGTPVPQPPTA